MPFMDLIKKAIFEEEPLAQQPAKPATGSGKARPLEPAAPSYVPTGTRDNQFYTRLAKQTDLSAVPELAKIEAFAAPLASVITDKALRYKAALATAQSQGGLTKDAMTKCHERKSMPRLPRSAMSMKPFSKNRKRSPTSSSK